MSVEEALPASQEAMSLSCRGVVAVQGELGAVRGGREGCSPEEQWVLALFSYPLLGPGLAHSRAPLFVVGLGRDERPNPPAVEGHTRAPAALGRRVGTGRAAWDSVGRAGAVGTHVVVLMMVKWCLISGQLVSSCGGGSGRTHTPSPPLQRGVAGARWGWGWPLLTHAPRRSTPSLCPLLFSLCTDINSCFCAIQP